MWKCGKPRNLATSAQPFFMRLRACNSNAFGIFGQEIATSQPFSLLNTCVRAHVCARARV